MKKIEGSFDGAKIEYLLRDLLITTLALSGVKSTDIRKIVGCDMNRVTRIVTHIPEERK